MRKWLQNYVMFLVMLLLALYQAVSGIVLWFVLPKGQGFQGGRNPHYTGEEQTFIWGRDTWIEWHDWTAVALLALLILHLILHWKWITYMTKKAFTGPR